LELLGDKPSRDDVPALGLLIQQSIQNNSLQDHKVIPRQDFFIYFLIYSQERFLGVYTASILGDRVAPTRTMHQAFVPLLKHITAEDLSTYGVVVSARKKTTNIYIRNSKVLPIVDRALKRNPEAVIEEVSFLVSNLSLDLSPFAAGSGATFVAMVTPHLASRDERIQNGAIDVIREVAKTVSSSEALVALLKGVAGALSGSHTTNLPFFYLFSIFIFFF